MGELHTLDASDLLATIDREGEKFGVYDAADPRDYRRPVGEIRRRRGRLADGDESGMRDVALVERDGVLLWVFSDPELDGRGAGARRRRARRAAAGVDVEGNVLRELSVPVLGQNEYLAALAETDKHLNDDCNLGLRVVEKDGERFAATGKRLEKKYAGRTLLLVHGTFSSSTNTLAEYESTGPGRAFLNDALTAYGGQVLVFDHPTLSVSPFLNAIDLARALAGTEGGLDVIAHSRGGVVVRWWLDVLGDSLAGADVRAVLVGSPLRGTSLAAPGRIHSLVNVLANIGTFISKPLRIAAATNPYTLASMALLKFLVKREANRWGVPPGNLGKRPDLDAAVAVIPGLQGQSGVENNYELIRLFASPKRANVEYFAITAEFEPERIGWKLWKAITEFRSRGIDAVADKIFPGKNDLVVDTASMSYLDKGRKIRDVHDFGAQAEVHHCSYFRQPDTIAALRKWLD